MNGAAAPSRMTKRFAVELAQEINEAEAGADTAWIGLPQQNLLNKSTSASWQTRTQRSRGRIILLCPLIQTSQSVAELVACFQSC